MIKKKYLNKCEAFIFLLCNYSNIYMKLKSKTYYAYLYKYK